MEHSEVMEAGRGRTVGRGRCPAGESRDSETAERTIVREREVGLYSGRNYLKILKENN